MYSMQHKHTHLLIHTHTRTHTHTHACTHTCTHTHIYINTLTISDNFPLNKFTFQNAFCAVHYLHFIMATEVLVLFATDQSRCTCFKSKEWRNTVQYSQSKSQSWDMHKYSILIHKEATYPSNELCSTFWPYSCFPRQIGQYQQTSWWDSAFLTFTVWLKTGCNPFPFKGRLKMA